MDQTDKTIAAGQFPLQASMSLAILAPPDEGVWQVAICSFQGSIELTPWFLQFCTSWARWVKGLARCRAAPSKSFLFDNWLPSRPVPTLPPLVQFR